MPAKGTLNVRQLIAPLCLARHYEIDVIAAHLYGSVVRARLAGTLLRGVRPPIGCSHRFHLVIAGNLANAPAGQLEQLSRELDIQD